MDVVELLRGTKVFASAEPEHLAWVAQWAQLSTVARGHVLLKQGDPSDTLVIVVAGRFAVTIDDKAEHVAEVGAGEVLGEIGFFAQTPRTATVTAIRDSLVLTLDHAVVEELLVRAPAVHRSITGLLARRLAETTKQAGPPTSRPPRTIVIVPLGGVDVAPFETRLVSALGRYGRTIALTAPSLLARAGARSIDDTAVTAALDMVEHAHDTVVYVAGHDLDGWSKLCVRAADEVLFVGEGDAPPAPSPAATFAMATIAVASRRLVRLHARRSGAVTGTWAWLERIPCRHHHHVTLGDDNDVAALARFVAFRAVGFVASGGGAFGPAHIGVFRALSEAGIVFDVVGGTSVGAAMTAGFAMGGNYDQLVEGTHDIFITSRAFKRYTWPRYALLDHGPFDAALQRQYRGAHVEDMWTRYFAVATDLSTVERAVITRGPVWKAVRASSAIPGIVLPMLSDDGHLLVDGGLVDNTPLDVMRMVKTGPNVVVRFRSDRIDPVTADYEAIPSRAALMRAFLGRGNRRALPDLPSPVALVRRSMFRSITESNGAPGPKDLVLDLPVFPGSSMLDWTRHREVAAAGYAWTAKRLDELDKRGDPALAALKAAIAGTS